MLSILQIIAVAQAAGFSGDDLITAVAIALAESQGNPNAYNPETAAHAPVGKGSYGLWQIYLNAHPEFAGQNLYDPQTNAVAAYSVYAAAGDSFRPWSTFASGVYAANVDAVTAALNPPAAPAPPSQDVVATDTGDGTDTGTGTDGSGSPSGSDLAVLAVGGALALWVAMRLIG